MFNYFGQFNPLFKEMSPEPYASSAWELMQKGGFNSVDIDLDPRFPTNIQMQNASKFKKEAKEWKLKPLCFHSSPFHRSPEGDFDIETQIINMRIAAEYGVDFFLIHPYMSSAHGLEKLSLKQKTEHMKFNLDSIMLIAKHAKKHGLRTIVENEVFTDFDFYFKLLDELPPEICGAILDAGHANLQVTEKKIPLNEIIYKLSNRLEHLHLHDNDGISDLHIPMLTQLGTIKWDKAFKALKDIEYKGCLNEELTPWTGNALIMWSLRQRRTSPLKDLWHSV